MAVTLNPAALAVLLDSEAGPVGREVRRRADAVEAIAQVNVTGKWLNMDTHDLFNGLKVTQTEAQNGSGGPAYLVGSDAEHGGFRYPGWWDENGRPWLSEALADVFPGG